MTPATSNSVFALSEQHPAKADPTLIAADEQHFTAMATALDAAVEELSARLDHVRRLDGGAGQQAMDRDLEVHRLSARLRTLRRYSLDLCLGRIVPADQEEPVYVGRVGLTDSSGRRLLVDWRSPAAEPFFGATHADPMGLLSRRRYRWVRGRVDDYWDEVFTVDGLAGHAALDDQSAFIATLGSSRSPRMRDVLGTIQADQDAIIRAGSRGPLVVDGGPGTGKTVVALHRTAYLLYHDPRLGDRRGGVLFVGPHRPYLSYVGDVLPSLGEDGVRTCTLRDLVPEGASAGEETDPATARLKARPELVAAIEPAVRFYEEPPDHDLAVDTPWGEVTITAGRWAEAFDAADPGTPHNEARDEVWNELCALVWDLLDLDDADVSPGRFRRALAEHDDLVDTFTRAWPVIDAPDLVGDLWSVPAYLRLAAPWLAPEEVRRLQRADPAAWTVSDLPLLDAARRRLGDPDISRQRQRRRAAQEAHSEEMARVVDHLVTTDGSEMQVMSMLRVDDLRGALVDEQALPSIETDPLAGPFAHVVVDEAQELTDAEWQMLLARCPSRSLTIVGDRAQARHGFVESWSERLQRAGLDRVRLSTLSINYRTPREVMAEAEPVIRTAIPDANVPTSVRGTGVPVDHGDVRDLEHVLSSWLEADTEGVACVIGAPGFQPRPEMRGRVRSLTPELCKGLEFDLVVLVNPDRFGAGIEGAVDRYVAMTRATQRLVVLTGR